MVNLVYTMSSSEEDYREHEDIKEAFFGAEIVYDVAKKEVARTGLWLGPVVGERCFLWTQLTSNFEELTRQLQPICTENFFYKLEMARQAGLAGNNPVWAVREIREVLDRVVACPPATYQSLPLPNNHPNFKKIVVTFTGKYKEYTYTEDSGLRECRTLTNVSLQDLCTELSKNLSEFCKLSLNLENVPCENPNLKPVEDTITELHFYLTTLVHFYNKVNAKTKIPDDLKKLVENSDCKWDNCPDEVPPVTFHHSYMKKVAKKCLSFNSTE